MKSCTMSALLIGAAYVAVGTLGAIVPSQVSAAEDANVPASVSPAVNAVDTAPVAAVPAAAEEAAAPKVDSAADDLKTVAASATESVPASIAPAPAPVAAAAPAPAVSASKTLPSSREESLVKSVTKMSDKAMDAAKDKIKDLESMEETTLQDLTEARQTITRIDAMIDMEKKINELQKIRADRRSIGVDKARIAPPSLDALLPPVAPIAGIAPAPAMPVSFPTITPVSSKPEVAHIQGTEGRYVAVLKFGTSKDRQSVRIGDKLPNGDVVESITSSSVVLMPAGKGKRTPYTINVKNVDVVHGSVR